jgi:hypothetical protein
MIVIKFSLTGGFVELYFKSQDTADMAFGAYNRGASEPARKGSGPSSFVYTDDFNRVASVPYDKVNGAQLFALEDEIAAQINIAQVRNDATLREQQRVQTRASGLIVPAGAPLPR